MGSRGKMGTDAVFMEMWAIVYVVKLIYIYIYIFPQVSWSIYVVDSSQYIVTTRIFTCLAGYLQYLQTFILPLVLARGRTQARSLGSSWATGGSFGFDHYMGNPWKYVWNCFQLKQKSKKTSDKWNSDQSTPVITRMFSFNENGLIQQYYLGNWHDIDMT